MILKNDDNGVLGKLLLGLFRFLARRSFYLAGVDFDDFED